MTTWDAITTIAVIITIAAIILAAITPLAHHLHDKEN